MPCQTSKSDMAWISKAGGLNQQEMENNADIVISTYQQMGYDNATIAAILGNMQNESSVNPGREEEGGGGGYGLVQWTPKSVLIEHCATLGLSPYTSGDVQLQVIPKEIQNVSGVAEWYSSAAFIEPYYNSGATSDMIGITGNQFLQNSMGWTPDKLAVLFMVCYERPSYDPNTNHYQKRMADALTWYDYIGGGCVFTPRLTDSGMMNNPYWYSQNPFYLAGFGLPNCTCYAWGRAYEIMGKRPTLSLGNADQWFGYTPDGYSRGSTAKLGAIICYSGGSVGTGHVGVVEVINDDGTIVTSNSNYGAEYFITYNLPADYSMAGLTFQGFIYIPCGGKPPFKRGNKMPWIYYLKRRVR